MSGNNLLNKDLCYYLCVCGYPWRPEEGVRSVGTVELPMVVSCHVGDGN